LCRGNAILNLQHATTLLRPTSNKHLKYAKPTMTQLSHIVRREPEQNTQE
jgi:hypothetical protein